MADGTFPIKRSFLWGYYFRFQRHLLELFWQEPARRSKMEPFTMIVVSLGILNVLGIIGILIEPLLRDKEEPQA